MRRVRSFLVAAVGLIALTGPVHAQGAMKIGFVDTRRLMTEAPGAQEARQAMEQDMVKFQSELQQLEDSLKAMITNYEQRAVVLSPEARQQQEEAIRQKQRAYQQRAGELEDQAGRRQAELFEPIMARISQAINEVRAEGGYAVILDAAAGGIVAADPSLDLTEQVLTRLKAMATAGNRQQR